MDWLTLEAKPYWAFFRGAASEPPRALDLGVDILSKYYNLMKLAVTILISSKVVLFVDAYVWLPND